MAYVIDIMSLPCSYSLRSHFLDLLGVNLSVEFEAGGDTALRRNGQVVLRRAAAALPRFDGLDLARGVLLLNSLDPKE